MTQHIWIRYDHCLGNKLGESKLALPLSDIVVAENATVKLYSDSVFATEITVDNTLPLTDGGIAYKAGQNIAITDNVTMTAVWTAVPAIYTVTYNYNYTGGGTYTTQTSIAQGATLTARHSQA